MNDWRIIKNINCIDVNKLSAGFFRLTRIMVIKTKQLRLSDPIQIRKHINDFLGKKINIVLKDNRVVIGELENLTENGITFKNMRLKKTHFSFAEISEIYFDIIV